MATMDVVISALAQANLPSYDLYQHNFANGPVIIDQPGKWILREDIILNFQADNDYKPPVIEPHNQTPANQDKAHSLGFFAGIIITAKHVHVDLNGYRMSMHKTFALQQRFFSLIELASTPFLPGQGPGDFGAEINSAQYVLIENGTLGLSSHHCIRGNKVDYVHIRNLRLYEFEIAGIALNGGKHWYMQHLDIGPNRRDVPVKGNYSAARFLPQFYQQLIQQVNNVDRRYLAAKLLPLQRDLWQALHDYEKFGHLRNILYASENGLSDGNNYGILLHPPGVAINDYVTAEQKDICQHVEIKDVHVHDLHVNVTEIVGLSLINSRDAQRDVTDSVFDIVQNTDEAGYYRANNLAQLQLALAKMALKYKLKLGKSSITADLISWAEEGKHISWLLRKGYQYVCCGDIMHHVSKPLHGFRLDGIKYLTMYDCSAKNLINYGRMGSLLAGNYKLSHDKQILPGYNGSMTVGFNFSHIKKAHLHNLRCYNLTSKNGLCIGIRFLNSCRDSYLKGIIICNLRAGYKLHHDQWYGLNHEGAVVKYDYKRPNYMPRAIGVKLSMADAIKLCEICIENLTGPGPNQKVVQI